MGIGPANMDPGDRVCVLFGGPTPYIVRPVEGKHGEYLFVGECYIQKWMDGAALDLVEKGDLSPEWFNNGRTLT